jgi:CRP/FNR family transcriptional regulator, cyclic AMP receptor protein
MGLRMRTTEEKAQVLRWVGLFAKTAADDLPQIAAVLEEIAVEPGTAIVVKGAVGDCLYIIVDGRAQAHDGPLVFNELCAGDVFGEMAVLDSEVRSATVTAMEPTTLFRLGQQPLYELIHTNSTLALGVIKSLSRHLRNRVRDRARDYEYIQQVSRITMAAQAVEQGDYAPTLLAEVARRDDELGLLARVFRHMAAEVHSREQRLRQQLDALRIEVDRERLLRQVSEITESEYFQQLRVRADSLRGSIDDDDG